MASNDPIGWYKFETLTDIYKYLWSHEYILQISDGDSERLQHIQSEMKITLCVLADLIGMFARKHGIWLYILLSRNKKLEIMNDNWPITSGELRKKVFLIFSSDCENFGVVSHTDEDGFVRTIFDIKDSIERDIRQHVKKLNQKFTLTQEPMEQCSNNDDDTTSPVQETAANDVLMVEHSSYSRTTTEHENNRLIEYDSNEWNSTNSNIGQLPTHHYLSTTITVPTIDDVPASQQTQAKPPEILEKLPDKIRIRYLRCLQKNECSIIKNDNGLPIRIRVPKANEKSVYIANGCSTDISTTTNTNNDEMYLGITTLTLDNKIHPFILIVPENVTVQQRNSYKNNNLDCLNIDQCKPMHDCVIREKTICICSKITAEEHEQGLKDVRIYPFRLYQDETITKELIESQQLKRFKLAFQYCILRNGVYNPVSDCTDSSEILAIN